MQLTVGWDAETGGWGYQTGDNSFMGGAYGYPTWGLASIYRDSDPAEVADEIRDDLLENCPDPEPAKPED